MSELFLAKRTHLDQKRTSGLGVNLLGDIDKLLSWEVKLTDKMTDERALDATVRTSERNAITRSYRQRYTCRHRRDFIAPSMSAFSGYCWPGDVILTAVRWYASYPLSVTHVMPLLTECHIEVSARVVVNSQTEDD